MSFCLILRMQVCFTKNMKNNELTQNNIQISDPIESYFDCITSCDLKDGICISKCVEILREPEY